MKHYFFFNYLLLVALVSLSSACSEDERVSDLICFQKGGCIAVNFAYQDEAFEYKINIVNRNSGASSTTQISLFTQEELVEYNQKNATNYQMMPKETYEIDKTSVTFSNQDNPKEICLKIHPQKLFDIVRKDTETKLYAIPLKLSNQSTYNNNSIAVYVMNMSYPKLCLNGGANIRLMKNETEISLEAYTYKEKKLIPNQGNIDLNLMVPDNAEEWLEMYNDTSATKYQLLPAGAYELGKVVGTEGEDKCNTSIKIKRTLTSGVQLGYGHFILPIKLTGVDDHIALNHDISVVTINNPNSYDDVGREYDDGENIIFHVKLAIDKEGLEMMDNDMEFFRNSLAIQWDEINRRFNGLDKKRLLKRNYIFVPDLKDIIIFKYVDGNSSWNVANDYADRIDANKFQLVVSYDCVQQSDEGGGGYGGTTPDGINHIKVTCYSKNTDEIRHIFSLESLSEESIVHELGHFRGIIDTYWCELNASDNLITHQGFQPERGNMMGACYEPLETIEWSEYEAYVINATGAQSPDIYKTMAKYFPDNVEITVTENGKPIEGFTLNFYPKDYTGSKIEKVSQTYTQNGNKITLNAKVPLFWPWQIWYESSPHAFNRLLLAEAVSQRTGKKGYIFIPVYEVHKQGLKDKSENPITEPSVFKATIDIK